MPVLGEVRPRVVLGFNVHGLIKEVELAPRVGDLGLLVGLVVQPVHEVRVEDLAHEVQRVPCYAEGTVSKNCTRYGPTEILEPKAQNF